MTSVVSVHVRSRDARYVQDIRIGKHTLVADEPEAVGGADEGPPPYALLLSALGACTSITLRMYAERKGWEVGSISVALRHFKEGDADRIERRLRFEKPLSEERKTRLLEIAQKTPVTKTVLHGAAITTTLEESDVGELPKG